MATESKVVHKKRAPSNTRSSDPVPEGDHRKRRRNRITQSCLNCHTSKRMCDRKRPCGRCTQLGLTGLCVYEVDDPSRRSGAQDENSRLRQRVAELEGVIRELKNKPHPRWAKSGSDLDKMFEQCHARALSCSASGKSVAKAQPRSDPPHPSPSNPNTGSNEQFSDRPMPSLPPETAQLDCLSTTIPSSISPPATGSSVPLTALAYSPCFDAHSPASVPSTSVTTPMEDPQIQIAEDQQLTNDIDLTSLLMSCSDLLACDEGLGNADRVPSVNIHRENVGPFSTKKYNPGQFLDGHCGCLNEAVSYNAVLELSLRLRKAADILSRSVNHRFSNGCPLNRGIADLDIFATTALGNIATCPSDSGSIYLRSRASTTSNSPIPSLFSTVDCIPPIRIPAVLPPSLRSLGSWSVASHALGSPASCDESFMNWYPSRWG